MWGRGETERCRNVGTHAEPKGPKAENRTRSHYGQGRSRALPQRSMNRTRPRPRPHQWLTMEVGAKKPQTPLEVGVNVDNSSVRKPVNISEGRCEYRHLYGGRCYKVYISMKVGRKFDKHLYGVLPNIHRSRFGSRMFLAVPAATPWTTSFPRRQAVTNMSETSSATRTSKRGQNSWN